MGQQLCGKSPLGPHPPALEPVVPDACVERNEDVMDRLIGGDVATMNEEYGDYLLQVADAAAAEAKRGNTHLKDAIEEVSAMRDAFAADSRDDFVSAGVRTLAAVAEVEDAVKGGNELLDQENLAWRPEITDAQDELKVLAAALADVDAELFADLKERLGLELSRDKDAVGERIQGVQLIAVTHLAAGLELRALGDLLGDVDPADARPIARELAKDNGLNAEDGTEAYYNGFMEDSEASPEIKGWYAHALGIPLLESGSYYEYDEDEAVCGVNDAGALRALEEAKAARDAEAKRMMLQLGVVKDPLGGGFSKVAGKLADLLVTDDGESAGLELSLTLAVPLPIGVDATVDLKLGGGLKRDKDQRQVSASFEFLVGAQVDAMVAKAFIKAGLIGKISASGDSFEEAFRLTILGLYDRMYKTSPSIADAAFGGEEMEAVSDEMDADDSVAYSLGVKAGAGMEVDPGGPDDKVGGGAQVEALWGTRLTGGVGEKDGLDVRRQDTSSVKASASGNVGKWGLSASIEAGSVDGVFSSMEVAGEASATLGADDLAEHFFKAEMGSNLLDTTRSAIQKTAAAFDKDQPGYKRALSLKKQLERNSGIDAKLKAAANGPLSESEVGGVSSVFKLSVTGKAGITGPAVLEVVLSKETELSVGHDAGKVSVQGKATTGRELVKFEL